MFLLLLLATVVRAENPAVVVGVPSDAAGSLSAPAPQRMMGIELGQPFDTTGYACDDKGRCVRPSELDGLRGELSVDVCGGRAWFVQFSVLSVKEGPRVRRAGLDTRSIYVERRPERPAFEATAAFLTRIQDWSMSPPQRSDEDGVELASTRFVSPEGHAVTLLTGHARGREWFGHTWFTNMYAEHTTVCGGG